MFDTNELSQLHSRWLKIMGVIRRICFRQVWISSIYGRNYLLCGQVIQANAIDWKPNKTARRRFLWAAINFFHVYSPSRLSMNLFCQYWKTYCDLIKDARLVSTPSTISFPASIYTWIACLLEYMPIETGIFFTHRFCIYGYCLPIYSFLCILPSSF